MTARVAGTDLADLRSTLPMARRLSALISARSRSRAPQAARGRRGGRGSCHACGAAIVANDHAIQLDGGVFHAGCVLYRPREVPVPPAQARLQASR